MRAVLLLMGWCFLALGCAQTLTTPTRPARINHVVFFVLSDPTDGPELIGDCEEMAAEIPGITSFYCGTHLDTGRETVLHDYDVGFYVGFESVEDLGAYVAHASHQALVAKWRPRLAALRVYDVIDETR